MPSPFSANTYTVAIAAIAARLAGTGPGHVEHALALANSQIDAVARPLAASDDGTG